MLYCFSFFYWIQFFFLYCFSESCNVELGGWWFEVKEFNNQKHGVFTYLIPVSLLIEWINRIEWNIDWTTIWVGSTNKVLSWVAWCNLWEDISEDTKSEVKSWKSNINRLDQHVKVAWVFSGLHQYIQYTECINKIVRIKSIYNGMI